MLGSNTDYSSDSGDKDSDEEYTISFVMFGVLGDLRLERRQKLFLLSSTSQLVL